MSAVIDPMSLQYSSWMLLNLWSWGKCNFVPRLSYMGVAVCRSLWNCVPVTSGTTTMLATPVDDTFVYCTLKRITITNEN